MQEGLSSWLCWLEPCQKSGTHFLNIGGWGAELNREIISCRACVRAVCECVCVCLVRLG